MSEKKIATADIARTLHEKSDITLDQAKKFVNSYFSLIEAELVSQDSASVYKFGTFKKQMKAQRTSRNPRTGEVILVPAKYAVTFSPVHAVAEKINEPYAHLQAVEIDEDESDKEKERQIAGIDNFAIEPQDKTKDEEAIKTSGTQIEQEELVKLWGIGKIEEPPQPAKKIEVVAPSIENIKVISKQPTKTENAASAKTQAERKRMPAQTAPQNVSGRQQQPAKKISGAGQNLQRQKNIADTPQNHKRDMVGRQVPKVKELIIERQIIKEQIIEQQVRKEICETLPHRQKKLQQSRQAVLPSNRAQTATRTSVIHAPAQNDVSSPKIERKAENSDITKSEYKMLFARSEKNQDISKDLKAIARCWFGAGVAVVFTAIVLGVLVYSLVTARQNYERQQINAEAEQEQQLTDLAQMRTATPNAYASIAAISYGDARLWPYIYSANRLQYFDPDYDVAKKNFVLPRNPDKTLDASMIERSAIDAYNMYKIIYNEKPSAKNREKYLRAVKVIAETEEVMPGFLSRYELSFTTDDVLLAKRYLGD